MELGTLFNFAILLFCGLIFAKIIRYFKLPDVTGYLIGGLIIGPSVLGLLSADAVAGLSLVSDVALGFIAFSIGSEFKLSYFKRVGMTPIVIAIFESFVAVLFVTLGLVLSGQTLPVFIGVGRYCGGYRACSHHYGHQAVQGQRAVTETLLSVVAIDDATALIAFGIAVAVAQTLTSTADVSLVLSILKPVLEIAEALLGGALLGVLFTVMLRFFKVSQTAWCWPSLLCW